MLSKQQIFDTLDQKFSKSCIKQIDGEYRLVGKFGEIAYAGEGIWDIWFHNPENLSEPLSEQKLTWILKSLPSNWDVFRLTGEAYTQAPVEEVIRYSDLLAEQIKLRRYSKAMAEAATRNANFA